LDLRLAFLLYVGLPLLAILGVAGSLSLGALEELNEERLKEDLELIGRTLQKPMGRALERNRQGTLENALASAFSFGRVYGAYLYDSDGYQLASAGAAQPANSAAPEIIEKADQEGKTTGEYGRVGGREVYSFFAPLTDTSGQMNGLLQITRRTSEIETYTQQLRIYGAAGLATLALALVTVTFLGYRRAIARPLARLATSMQRVAEGDLAHRTAESGPREITELSRTFNGMLDRMQRDRKEIQQRRANQEQLQRELHQSEKMASIGRLSAGVAHELGAPLSVVDGTAQRLLRKPEINTTQRHDLERIREQTSRMTQIVEQLLAFGRHPEGSPRAVLVERLTRAVARNAQEILEDANCELRLTLPADPLYVFIDPFQGEQMLSHLITNAAQAAPGGLIEVRWEASGSDRVLLTVADSGTGVDPDLRERVFEPFYTTKAPGQGTGLGLAMVHGIVEEHGGNLQIGDSELGGAMFRIELTASAPGPVAEGSQP